MKNLILGLLCLCFLAHVDYSTQTMMFCNEIEGKDKFEDVNIKDVKVVMDWHKDDKTCEEGCSYWRVLKTTPDETLCVEIQYNFGKKEL